MRFTFVVEVGTFGASPKPTQFALDIHHLRVLVRDAEHSLLLSPAIEQSWIIAALLMTTWDSDVHHSWLRVLLAKYWFILLFKVEEGKRLYSHCAGNQPSM